MFLVVSPRVSKKNIRKITQTSQICRLYILDIIYERAYTSTCRCLRIIAFQNGFNLINRPSSSRAINFSKWRPTCIGKNTNFVKNGRRNMYDSSNESYWRPQYESEMKTRILLYLGTWFAWFMQIRSLDEVIFLFLSRIRILGVKSFHLSYHSSLYDHFWRS